LFLIDLFKPLLGLQCLFLFDLRFPFFEIYFFQLRYIFFLFFFLFIRNLSFLRRVFQLRLGSCLLVFLLRRNYGLLVLLSQFELGLLYLFFFFLGFFVFFLRLPDHFSKSFMIFPMCIILLLLECFTLGSFGF